MVKPSREKQFACCEALSKTPAAIAGENQQNYLWLDYNIYLPYYLQRNSKPCLEIYPHINQPRLRRFVIVFTTVLTVDYSFHSLEAYRDQDPSPDHSSGSESGSESSHSRSQSPSSSGSSSSEEEGSRTESVHAPAPSSEAPQSRTSALCLRNISLRSGGR